MCCLAGYVVRVEGRAATSVSYAQELGALLCPAPLSANTSLTKVYVLLALPELIALVVKNRRRLGVGSCKRHILFAAVLFFDGVVPTFCLVALTIDHGPLTIDY